MNTQIRGSSIEIANAEFVMRDGEIIKSRDPSQIELAAAYERIEEMKQAFRMLNEMIESGEIDEDRDIALGVIQEQLDEHKVILTPCQ
jgi:hypothetical protein